MIRTLTSTLLLGLSSKSDDGLRCRQRRLSRRTHCRFNIGQCSFNPWMCGQLPSQQLVDQLTHPREIL